MGHEAPLSGTEAALAATVLDSVAPVGAEARTEYEQSLRMRTDIEWALTERARVVSQTGDANSDYGFTLGYYGGGESFDENGSPVFEHSEQLLSEQIDTLLSSSEGRPAVYVDFGGGLGFSSIRLAAKYARDIAEGRLIMVVTNLGFPPAALDGGRPDIAQALSQTYPNGFSAENLEFVRQYQDLVTYLDANALELDTTTVFTHEQEPQAVPLKGNVGILHEQFALTHSHVPDMALAAFDDLMSPDGTMYLQTAYVRTDLGVSMHRSIVEEVEISGDMIDLNEPGYDQQRLSALDIGLEILDRRFERIRSPGHGILSVYRRRAAQGPVEREESYLAESLVTH